MTLMKLVMFFLGCQCLLGQWLNFKFFGITYLVGKIKFIFFFRVHWLSENVIDSAVNSAVCEDSLPSDVDNSIVDDRSAVGLEQKMDEMEQR